MNLSRSRDDELFGPAFAELEELLAGASTINGHPPTQILRAYLGRSLEEELVSVVSLHVLLCTDCQSQLWSERLKNSRWRRFREEHLGRWTLERRAAFAYATVGIVLGLSLALLITWTTPPAETFAGGGGGYPPPRPF